MKGLAVWSKPANLLLVILFLQITLFLSIIFDICVLRQVLGFFYLTFVPGFVILRLLRLKIEGIEVVLFVVGLSVVFLMGEGFLLNLVGPMVGIPEPLGLGSVLVVTSIFVITSLLLIIRDHNEPAKFAGYKQIVIIGLVLGGILVLAVCGGLLATFSSEARIFVLFSMLIAIAALFGSLAFYRKRVPSNLYPIILFAVALALLFHVSFFSSYIVGGDIYGEYALFKITVNNLHWDSTISNPYNAMLSVTILPAIYSIILNLDGTWVFKIVYPLIFAFVPLGLYMLFKHRVSLEVAFFSVFFFVSNITFFVEMLQLARQMIGELFYVLLFITMFSGKLKGFAKWSLFALFGFGLVVSHYSLAYIFLACIFAVWLVGLVRKRATKVTGGMFILFAVMTFAWFIYISSGAAFSNFQLALNSVQDHFLTDFFNPQSRGGQVLQAIGVSGIPTFWHTVGRYQYYVIEALIIIGVFGLLTRKKWSFFNDEFNVLVLCNLLILGACIVLPNFASTFTVTRFYHVALFFLAPFCILGAIAVLNLLSRNKFKEKFLALIVVLAVLIPYFFFQTGFVYEVAKEDSYLLPLSSYRFDSMKLAHMDVINSPEVSGAVWLSRSMNKVRPVYADIYSGAVFSYVGGLSLVKLTPKIPVTSGSSIYLLQYNLDDKLIFNDYGSTSDFNTSQIVPSLDSIDLVYSSGSCAIFQNSQ